MKFENARQAAEFYLTLGLRPIPLYGLNANGCGCQSPACKPRDWGKHEPPETDGTWKDGEEFGPADFSESHNIAVALGPWGGSDDWLVALDFDGQNAAGLLFVAELALPDTLIQETPRGFHAIYSVPAYAPLGNWVDVFQTKPEGFQLDLRYARGRIVVPPSRNAAGQYRWQSIREPTPLPARIQESILDRRRERGLEVLDEWSRGTKRA